MRVDNFIVMDVIYCLSGCGYKSKASATLASFFSSFSGFLIVMFQNKLLVLCSAINENTSKTGVFNGHNKPCKVLFLQE